MSGRNNSILILLIGHIYNYIYILLLLLFYLFVSVYFYYYYIFSGLEIHFFCVSKLLLPGARPGSKTNFVVAKLYVHFFAMKI